jgi:hypothetical protein
MLRVFSAFQAAGRRDEESRYSFVAGPKRPRVGELIKDEGALPIAHQRQPPVIVIDVRGTAVCANSREQPWKDCLLIPGSYYQFRVL